ncbi:MAG: site-specific DNA-methyltransferase [Ignavibacteria bacterium]|nr:site-specific DNA-methyltransferase [Ignavibacteria bacterium]
MKPLTATDPETKSADVLAGNIEHLKTLLPEAWIEGKVDFDVLKQLLGGLVDEREEKFGLNWHGKRRARQLALTPSTGTLRPRPDDSVDWDTTQNLMIEGDNLEVLKLLQKSYAGKVKLIYIDPLQHRKDFVYPDNFQDNIKNYLQITGQTGEGGKKLSSNTEASGRFHTDWLNMMYPRLKLAKNLLKNDGIIFISIDDAEVAHLRIACDDIFGEENFVAELVWEGANKNDAKQVGIVHEYVLVYSRNREYVARNWSLKKEGVEPVLAEVARLKAIHGADYESVSTDLAGWFRAMKATPSFGLRRFRYVDERGVYKEDDPTAPGGRRFELKNPKSDEVIPLRKNRGWGFDQAEFDRLVAEGRISFISKTSIMVRRYLHETDSITPPSVFYQPARSASERLARLMEADVFDFPKDEEILSKFVEMATGVRPDDECIVVDFFAGSGTAGHAVMKQNAEDNGNRRYVLVQLPEPLHTDNKNQKVASDYCDELGKPRTIAELTKERLRRAAKKIQEENPMFAGDLGFRVFKLDSTNIREWDPNRNSLAESLEASIEHLKTDRTEQDILFELLLKLGLDLCVPIEAKMVAGAAKQTHEIHSIGGGSLLVCLSPAIPQADVETLSRGLVAWHKAFKPAGETTVVFRDSAFADDVAKTNLTAILHQHGLETVRSL